MGCSRFGNLRGIVGKSRVVGIESEFSGAAMVVRLPMAPGVYLYDLLN